MPVRAYETPSIVAADMTDLDCVHGTFLMTTGLLEFLECRRDRAASAVSGRDGLVVVRDP